MVVYQNAEPVFQTVPDVPDEGAMMEKFAVLLEEFIPQPEIEILTLASDRFQKRFPDR